MKIAFWSKVHWGCCVENGSETSLPPVQVFCIAVQRMRELIQLNANQTKKQFVRQLYCSPLGCAYTDDMSTARAGGRGQDTIAPSTAACLYFGCMSRLPGSLAACADLNPGVCAPVGNPACLCWNLYFCCCVASLLRELMWLNTNCCCIRVVHQAV